jgi:hypothetical protein
VCENRILRRIFGSKRDEVTREWRKLHIEELRDLYSSPNIILMIKSRRMRLAGHVARTGTRRGYTGFWWRKLRERDHFEDSGAGGKTLLKGIFRKWDGDIDCIDLARKRDRWRAVVDADMNLQVR